jgi:hypothetical protein
MKKPLTITLPKPCEQKWDDMTPEKGGRHCAACSKVITDFTLMSDSEIIDVFRKAKDHTPCGHFAESQLNRPLVISRRKQSLVGIYVKRVAALLLLVQSATSALAQQKKAVATHLQGNRQQVKPAGKRIVGCLINYADNKPVAGARVVVKELGIDTITSKEGSFVFTLPDSFNKATVVVESPEQPANNYTIVEETITLADIVAGKEITLYQYPVTRLPEHVIQENPRQYRTYTGIAPVQHMDLAPKRPGFWQRIIHPFKRKNA